jgi:predicted DNA binding CopG/RHH family protein
MKGGIFMPRKHSNTPKDSLLVVRLQKENLDAIKEKAAMANLSLSEYVRANLILKAKTSRGG